MWIKLHTCPLSESKETAMPLGEAAERTPTIMLRVDIEEIRFRVLVLWSEVWVLILCHSLGCMLVIRYDAVS